MGVLGWLSAQEAELIRRGVLLSFYYECLYRLGLTPWEEDPREGPAAEQISALFDREEEHRTAPFGPALDLGCGTGIWSVRLAERGWRVTGVDVVPRAIEKARARAAAAGVEAHFEEADVTALRRAGIARGFRFILDFECFNHLSAAQREDVGREVSAVAAPGATLLMLVWAAEPEEASVGRTEVR